MNAKALTFVAVLVAANADAAFLIEVDIDGAADGAATFGPNFSFGGDTTTAFTSVASPAFGLTGGDSIFGGDGVALLDTYLFTYTPGVDGDNLPAAAGTALNNDGDTTTGLAAGPAGVYAVYAVWPATTGVSGGDTEYTLLDGANNVVATTSLDQNGRDGLWVRLFEATLDDPADTYTLRQQPQQNTFVSMRAEAVLFDLVREIPEPSTLGFAAAAGFVGLARRRV